jgi:hypothetical protein
MTRSSNGRSRKSNLNDDLNPVLGYCISKEMCLENLQNYDSDGCAEELASGHRCIKRLSWVWSRLVLLSFFQFEFVPRALAIVYNRFLPCVHFFALATWIPKLSIDNFKPSSLAWPWRRRLQIDFWVVGSNTFPLDSSITYFPLAQSSYAFSMAKSALDPSHHRL